MLTARKRFGWYRCCWLCTTMTKRPKPGGSKTSPKTRIAYSKMNWSRTLLSQWLKISASLTPLSHWLPRTPIKPKRSRTHIISKTPSSYIKISSLRSWKMLTLIKKSRRIFRQLKAIYSSIGRKWAIPLPKVSIRKPLTQKDQYSKSTHRTWGMIPKMIWWSRRLLKSWLEVEICMLSTWIKIYLSNQLQSISKGSSRKLPSLQIIISSNPRRLFWVPLTDMDLWPVLETPKVQTGRKEAINLISKARIKLTQ